MARVCAIAFVAGILNCFIVFCESQCTSSTFPSMANGYYPSTIMTTTGYYNYYTCNYGYSSSGGNAWPYAVCTWTGTAYVWNTYYTCNWNPTYCPATGQSLANANTPTPNRGYRQNTSLICNSGYQSNGGGISPYYTCLSSSNSAGVFSPVAYSCVAIAVYCNPSTAPTLENGTSNTPYTTINSKTYFKCKMGYLSSGGIGAPPYFSCTSTGAWSSVTHTCDLILAYCNSPTAPTLPNAVSSPQTTIYSTTYFDCNSGFETNGASQPFYTCEPNTYLAGLWTPVSYSCEKSSDCCDPTTAPSLSMAVSNTPQTTINSVTYFTCNMGYISSGGTNAPPYFSCNNNCSYSAITYSCNPISTFCTGTLPILTNALVPTPQKFAYAETFYTCNFGYITNGPTQPYSQCRPVSASAGEYTPAIYSCEEIPNYCDSASAPTMFHAVSQAPYTTIFSVTQMTCSLGFVSSSGYLNTPHYSCQPFNSTNGVWSNITDTCTVINSYCDEASFPTIPNANSTNHNLTVYGTTAFVCNNGYVSNGPAAINPYSKCYPFNATSGVWSAVQYGCELISNYCPSDPSVNSPTTAAPNAVFSTKLGSSVVLACLPFYKYVEGSGQLNVTCVLNTQTSGDWTSATGYCTLTTTTTTTTLSATSKVSDISTQWMPASWLYILVGIGGGIFFFFLLGISITLLILKYTICTLANGSVDKTKSKRETLAGGRDK